MRSDRYPWAWLVSVCILLAWLALVIVLTSCAVPEPRIEVRTVNVAVPLPCDEPVPERPAMPTEALAHRPDLDTFVAAVAAEIDVREGYEGQLRTALGNCRAPITSGRPTPQP